MKSSNKQILERIKYLTKEINKHNQLYYTHDTPEISDYEYDSLFRELQNLEKEYPEYKQKDSPTDKVGSETKEEFKKFKHPFPMLSLANAMNKEEFTEFIQKREKDLNKEINSFFVEQKLDGLAMELIYINGILDKAVTRGDGITGEIVTDNVKTIKSVPIKLKNKFPDYLVVRGEVLMPKKSFNRLNEQRKKENQPLFSTPRNAASGSVRQLDPNVTKERNLIFYPYQIANYKDVFKIIGNTDNLFDLHKFLISAGFSANKYSVELNNINSVINYFKKTEKIRNKLEYDIDGIVVKINSIKDMEILGISGRDPRNAIAWKFKPEEAESQIIKIDFQVGRTGIITPVARINPVKIGGVTVSNVTLHNKEEIIRKDIHIGDFVNIIRSGDVIPKIINVNIQKRKNVHPVVFPQECPECGAKLFNSDDEVYIRCENPFCKGILINSLIHFVSKDCMNIEGLGKEQIIQMIEKKIINNISDIYKLNKEILSKLERTGEKSINNLLNSIENSKKVTLSKFINSLGIRQVGERTSKILANIFKNIENMFYLKKSQLENINDFGEKTIEFIYNFFNNKKNIEIIKEMLKSGVTPVYEEIFVEDNELKNKNIVFTGSLKKLSRRNAKELAEKYGGKIQSTVGKTTDILIVGTDPGSKLKKAKELNIKILTEEDFLKIINKETN